MGYSPCGHGESDTTERPTHMVCVVMVCLSVHLFRSHLLNTCKVPSTGQGAGDWSKTGPLLASHLWRLGRVGLDTYSSSCHFKC